MAYIEPHTKASKKASFALFLGGFVTFATLYTTQPLMPLFAQEFGVSASMASLSLSLSTGILAIAMIIAGSLSDEFGKKKIMITSMFAASIIGILTAFSANFWTLLAFRAILGIFLAGVPAIAMAYVSEEFNPKAIGTAMGLYISGTSIGGMSGRVLTGLLTDLFNWQVALITIGIIALAASITFYLTLPEPRNSEKKHVNFRDMLLAYKIHMYNRPLLAVISLGFLLMGSFVTLYNYVGFLLMEPPYSLSQTFIGFIFLVFLTGTFSAMYMGRKADIYGNPLILRVSIGLMAAGALFTFVPSLAVIIAGIALFTFGFFAAHSIASAWVGEYAGFNKTQASSMYLLLYYFGSSFIGSFGGWFWTHWHWIGVIGLVVILLALTFPLIYYAKHHQPGVFSSLSKRKKKHKHYSL
ncbi:MFS transporter [Domibacillus epiphyticus]|uniref:MFS transporter n=1 Tax=Domibacillus epiphyticus TaxID=1714355 RepID=A0A1V2A548_9BACI|nr:MFS transporter [Domibacillus epiphyticus]OMP65982.1 MFS transporter [Domibacillus epiphyticus]